MKYSLSALTILLAFAGGSVALNAQTAPPDAPRAQQPVTQQSVAQQPSTAQNQDATPISGTIMKEKGQYVLKDTASGASYKLDDQDKAKQFEGKQVKVTGKLDPNTNQIHVESIELVQQ
jgi:uncharacterized protein YdeI (BOF family)